MAIETIITASGKAKYRVCIWHKAKKICSATFSRKMDAEIWERQEKSILEQEKHFPDRPKPITYEECFKIWLRDHAEKNKAPSSLEKDRQMYRDYISPHFASKLLPEIRTKDLDTFVGFLTEETNLSNSSKNKILEVLRTTFNFAVSRRYFQSNPMASIKMLPVAEQPFDYWSFDESSQFLSFANNKYSGDDRQIYVFYLLLLTTGLRLGEAIALRWPAIMFDQRLIKISASFDRIMQTIKEKTKSKKIRYVPLDEELKKELFALKLRSTNLLIFSNQNKGIFFPDNFRNRYFAKDIKGSGVRRIRVHDFRHTFASHYMMNNGQLHDLQIILGHSEMKTTIRYAHLAPTHIAGKAGIVRFESDRFKNSEKILSVNFGESRPKHTSQIRPENEKNPISGFS